MKKNINKMTKKELIDEIKFFDYLSFRMDMFLYVLGLKDIFKNILNNQTYDEDDFVDDFVIGNYKEIKKVLIDFLDKYDDGNCADNDIK